MDLVSEPEQLVAEFSAAGFSQVEIHERTHDFALAASLFVFDHPMIAASPVLAGLSDDERAHVIEDAIDGAHRRSAGAHLLLPGTARIIIGTSS